MLLKDIWITSNTIDSSVATEKGKVHDIAICVARIIEYLFESPQPIAYQTKIVDFRALYTRLQTYKIQDEMIDASTTRDCVSYCMRAISKIGILMKEKGYTTLAECLNEEIDLKDTNV